MGDLSRRSWLLGSGALVLSPQAAAGEPKLHWALKSFLYGATGNLTKKEADYIKSQKLTTNKKQSVTTLANVLAWTSLCFCGSNFWRLFGNDAKADFLFNQESGAAETVKALLGKDSDGKPISTDSELHVLRYWKFMLEMQNDPESTSNGIEKAATDVAVTSAALIGDRSCKFPPSERRSLFVFQIAKGVKMAFYQSIDQEDGRVYPTFDKAFSLREEAHCFKHKELCATPEARKPGNHPRAFPVCSSSRTMTNGPTAYISPTQEDGST
jgi:hypothetical protein